MRGVTGSVVMAAANQTTGQEKGFGSLPLGARILALVSLPLLALNGVLTNAIGKVAGLNAGTLFVFALAAICALAGFLLVRGRLFGTRPGGLVSLVGAIGSGLALAAYYLSFYTTDATLAAKAVISYFLMPFAALFFYALPGRARAGVLLERGLFAMTAMLCAVGLAQYFLGHHANPRFLVLDGEPILGFPQVDWVRPTALVGNTILYSGLMYLVLMVHWSLFLVRGSRMHGLLAGASLTLQYLAMSRYGLTLSVVSVVATLAASARILPPAHRLRTLGLRAAVGILLPLVIGIALTRGAVLFDRFMGNSAFMQRTTEVHVSQKAAAVEHIRHEPPKGWGTEGISATQSIVPDGLWFQLGVETGIAGAALFMLWVALTVLLPVRRFLLLTRRARRLGREFPNRRVLALVVPILAYAGYSLFGGFINTSFSGRVVYFLFWALLGYALGAIDEEESRLAQPAPEAPAALAAEQAFVPGEAS